MRKVCWAIVVVAMTGCTAEPPLVNLTVGNAPGQALVEQITRFRLVVNICENDKRTSDQPQDLYPDELVDALPAISAGVRPGEQISIWLQGWKNCTSECVAENEGNEVTDCICFEDRDLPPAKLIGEDCTDWFKAPQRIELELDAPFSDPAMRKCPVSPPCR